ncbi:hypothetical protein PMAYCL1PPCAC_32222, partial [Pristionchus mayeri]
MDVVVDVVDVIVVLNIMHLALFVIAVVAPEGLGELVAGQLACVSGHHPEKEYTVLSQELEDESSERLGIHHLVALDARQVLADEVELPARNDGNVNPIEERADGSAGQQEVPEPEEEEDLLVEHV